MHIFNNKFVRRASVEGRAHDLTNCTGPHPAVQLFIWLCLTLAAHSLNVYGLLTLAGISIAFALVLCAARFSQLLRRMRWILISVFVIYAYSTPGDPLWMQLGAFSPVKEGAADGLLQLLRLTTVLAGLSILLTLLSPAQLVAGLYTVAHPLRGFGLSRERFAVRLALTLRYAESVPDMAGGWRGRLEQLLAQNSEKPGFVELQVARLTMRDWLIFAGVSAALTGIWL